jgi:hypothetical protein
VSIAKKDLTESVRRAGELLDILEKQIDAGFKDQESIQPGDPRLVVLHGMCSNPKGALTRFLTTLGGPAVPAMAPAGVAIAAPATAAIDFGASVVPPPAAPKPPDAGEGVSFSFDEFLTSVGMAMLNAQRQLDERSSDYLKESQQQPHVLPAIFRVPKLSASMKFAFEKRDDKKMNLVFYSAGSQQSTQHQQEIEFDIVSAPAPAEAMAELRQKSPRVDLILDPKQRDTIIAAARGAKLSKPTSKLPDDFEAGRCLLIALSAAAQYLMIYADTKQDGNVGMWRLTAGEPDRLEVIYRFDKKSADAEVSFQVLVNELADRQRDFLDSLRA